MEGDQERSELVGWGLAPRPTGDEGRAACVPSDELIGRLSGLGSRPDAVGAPLFGGSHLWFDPCRTGRAHGAGRAGWYQPGSRSSSRTGARTHTIID